MKPVTISSERFNKKDSAVPRPVYNVTPAVRIFLSSLLLIGILLTACNKQDAMAKNATDRTATTIANTGKTNATTDDLSKNYRHGTLSSKTLDELQQAKQATAKYQNLKNAIRDGYADINVVIPNMGFHFLKSANLDNKFEVRKPELLVYMKNENNNHFQLVAVEYAVPISLSPNAPPKGFTGNEDVWFYDTKFQLWTLHAWVWAFNPNGVFNPTNPMVM